MQSNSVVIYQLCNSKHICILHGFFCDSLVGAFEKIKSRRWWAQPSIDSVDHIGSIYPTTTHNHGDCILQCSHSSCRSLERVFYSFLQISHHHRQQNYPTNLWNVLLIWFPPKCQKTGFQKLPNFRRSGTVSTIFPRSTAHRLWTFEVPYVVIRTFWQCQNLRRSFLKIEMHDIRKHYEPQATFMNHH